MRALMLAACVGGLALGGCMPITDEPDAAPMAEMNTPPEAAGPIRSIGVVTAIDAAAGTVTLDHEPIEAIGWDAMTMRFTARDATLLEGVAAGDRVSFELESAENPRTLVALEKQ